MVQTYKEWVGAVNAEVDKLSAVDPYLNASGLTRLDLFSYFVNAAAFCDSATELLELLEDESMDTPEREILKCSHAKLPIKCLRTIAKKERRRKISRCSWCTRTGIYI